MEQEVINKEQKRVISTHNKGLKMRIAICDGDSAVIKEIKNQIYIYAENNRLDILVDCFLKGEEMIKTDVRYELIFLGYELLGANGMEIARKIRSSNEYTSIIFVSDSIDFIFDSFSVSPYRFLKYPIYPEKLNSVLNDFFKMHNENYPLIVKSREDMVFLKASEITYLEADNKHCVIHLFDESIPCNKTMAKVYEVLPKNNFIKINRAFIVNYRYISKFNSDMVYLKNGESLHITRNYLKSFKDYIQITLKEITV